MGWGLKHAVFQFLILWLLWSSRNGLVGLCGIAVDKSERTLGRDGPCRAIDLAQVFGRRTMEGGEKGRRIKRKMRERYTVGTVCRPGENMWWNSRRTAHPSIPSCFPGRRFTDET